MQANAIRIVEFRNPSGKIVFRVTGKDKDGNRVRKNFPTEGEAFAEKQRIEIGVMNVEAVPMVQTRLSKAQIQEAETAFQLLNGRSLLLAVQFFNENYREPLEKMTVRKAYEAFLLAKQSEKKLRPRAIQNLKSRVGTFVQRVNEGAFIHEITDEHAKAYVFKPGISARTATNNLYALNNFFRFCEKRRWVQSNPLAHAERPKNDSKTPETLSIAEVRRLFSVATEYKSGRLLPYFALATFAAIRPAEVERLTWDDIKGLDTDAPFAVIHGEAAKKRKRRTVTLSKNLVEWITPHITKRTPLVGSNWKRDFNRVRLIAGFGTPTKKHPNLKQWPDDVLRHTGITHKLNECGSAAKTALWAGNSEDVIHSLYKGLSGEAESKEFWSISPSDAKENVLKLKAA